MSDETLRQGLLRAFAMLPTGASSMFMGVRGANGKVASLKQAVAWDSDVSTPARLISALVFCLQLQPLGMANADARVIAEKLHGPRHVIPESGRAMLLPQPARDELGYWKVKRKGSSGGRMTGLSNRYSRDAERVLQVMLRGFILGWVRQRAVAATVVRELPLLRLQDLAPMPSEWGQMDAAWAAIKKAVDGL